MRDPTRLPSAHEELVLAAQAASPRVRLVGGAGLALLLGHRVSEDLDLFCGHRADIEPVLRRLEESARASGREIVRVRSGPGYARLEVPAGADSIRIDVASDTAAPFVAGGVEVGLVRVESLRDQRANKLVALLGRSELRDLVDLLFIERAGLRAFDGFEDAVAKDGGMDPAWLAWALGQVKARPLAGMVAELDITELERFRDALQDRLLDIAGAKA